MTRFEKYRSSIQMMARQFIFYDFQNQGWIAPDGYFVSDWKNNAQIVYEDVLNHTIQWLNKQEKEK